MTDANTSSAQPPPHGLPFFVAHTPPRGQSEPWHLLVEHSHSVARLAAAFAERFGGSALASYLGLLHDLGKFDDGFQKYLWDCFVAARDEKDAKSGPRPGSAPHKQAGALVAYGTIPKMGRHIAQILFGHHGAALGQEETYSEAMGRQEKAHLSLDEIRRLARSVDPALDPEAPPLESLFPAPHNRSFPALEMYLRFVFSCLTDADGLDTEGHMNPEQARRREAETAKMPPLQALRDTLLRNQEKLQESAGLRETAVIPVNSVRRQVYENCLRAAESLPPGVFTLTVPTGGGKTRSALAFALTHAVKHGLRRVIYAAPFTSIIDQTSQRFEEIFGEDSRIVLEHHSAIDPGESQQSEEAYERELWRRLAAQTWDAPLIVTTHVQLFESLFSNRPGKCRKLHRIARSVLILDEVQGLPPTLRRPLVAALDLLAENFGVTIVLCTATQPALDLKTASCTGFTREPVEIVQGPKAHFNALRRVHYRDETRGAPWDWGKVADVMRESGSCLCIVNARRQAVELMDILDPKREDDRVYHLSTLLCGRHRREVLDTVSKRLLKGLPTLLVSTTVVEAGVDVDFPRLLRALAPLPSIVQAAGRCNREGERRRGESEVTIFVPEDDVTPIDGIYRAAREQTRRALRRAAQADTVFDFDDPDAVTAWFADFAHVLSRGGQDDSKDISRDIKEFRFDEVARKMRLIPDETVSVLPIAYEKTSDEARAILKDAERLGGMSRELWQQVQPLCVSIYAASVKNLTDLEERDYLPGLCLWPGRYDEKTGVPLLSDPADGVGRQP